MITEFKCSLCDGYMTFYPDKEDGDFKAPGTVKCDNPCDPQCKENVYGHGSNAKDAYEISKQKFPKP